MVRPILTVLAAFVSVPIALASGAPSGRKIEMTPATVKHLKSGELVFGPDDTAYLLIYAHIDAIWSRLADIQAWPVIWGDIKVAKQLGKVGKYSEYSFVTKSPVGDKRYTLAFSSPSRHRLEWFLDKTQPADFRDTRGFWQLEPFEGPNATLVIYRGEYDAWWFPGGLQRSLASGVVHALRRWFAQNPTAGVPPPTSPALPAVAPGPGTPGAPAPRPAPEGAPDAAPTSPGSTRALDKKPPSVNAQR